MKTAMIFEQHEIERADDLTPITCLDCGGHWRRTEERSDGRHATIFCKYCLRGGMNETQQKAWREDKLRKRLDATLQDYVTAPMTPDESNVTSAFKSGFRKKL